MPEPKENPIVHARYTGETPQFFPHLLERRCCQEANQRDAELHHDEQSGELLSAPTLVRKGDVILIDRESAETRGDFEVLEDARNKGKSASKQPSAPPVEEAK